MSQPRTSQTRRAWHHISNHSRWLGVATACLGAAGCGSGQDLLGLGNNFDFRLSPSSVTIVRGSPEVAEVAVEVDLVSLSGDDLRDSRCTFDLPEGITGVARTGGPPVQGPGSWPSVTCEDWSFAFTATPLAPPGTYTLQMTGEWQTFNLTGETVTRTLTLEVLSELSVEITTPSPGITVIDGIQLVEADIETLQGEISHVELLVGAGAPDTTFAGPPSPSLSISTTTSLSPGENLITVRATNTLGNTWSDTVTVVYAPVTAGIARWDGEAGDGLWFTPTNWDGDVVPGTGDEVIIDDVTAEVLYAQDVVTSIHSLTNRGRLTLAQGGLRMTYTGSSDGDIILDHDLTTAARPVLWVDDAALTMNGALVCKRATLRGRGVIGGITVSAGGSTSLDLCHLDDIQLESHGDNYIGGETGRVTLGGETRLVNWADGTLTMDDGLIECLETPCPSTSTVSFLNEGQMTVTGFRSQIDTHFTQRGTLDFGTSGLWLGGGLNSGTITSAGASVMLRGTWMMEPSSSLSAGNVQVAPTDGGPINVVMQGSMNVGSVVVATGSVLEFRTGADITGLENLEVQGGQFAVTGNLQTEIGNLLLTSGSIRVETDATLYARKSFGWLEGTLQGAGTTVVSQADITQPEAQLSFAGYGPMNLTEGHRLTALGPTTWLGGDISAGNGAVFRITASGFSPALMSAYSDNTFDGNALGGAAARFVNEATLRKVGGSGTTTVEACYEGDLGTIVEEIGTVSIVQLCPPPM